MLNTNNQKGYKSFYNRRIKNLLDFCIAFCVIALFWWLFILIAIALKIESPSAPVIFSQKRFGKNGKIFSMHKFRSMIVGAEHTGTGVYSNDSDTRVTKIGRILRLTSLDELPQFINILKGDMSLIGFRPPLTYHPWKWEEYTEQQKQMFYVMPGITGYTQVNGRRNIEWHKRIEMNVWYANNVSFLLDLKIFILTFYKVLRNENNSNKYKTFANEQNEKLSIGGKSTC